jgi:hypothetical protein
MNTRTYGRVGDPYSGLFLASPGVCPHPPGRMKWPFKCAYQRVEVDEHLSPSLILIAITIGGKIIFADVTVARCPPLAYAVKYPAL